MSKTTLISKKGFMDYFRNKEVLLQVIGRKIRLRNAQKFIPDFDMQTSFKVIPQHLIHTLPWTF